MKLKKNPAELKASRKKDAKALALIQSAVHETVFGRIAAAETAKSAWTWTVLKKEFMGDSKVMVVRLQSLRREFETLMMKQGESVAYFLAYFLERTLQTRQLLKRN